MTEPEDNPDRGARLRIRFNFQASSGIGGGLCQHRKPQSHTPDFLGRVKRVQGPLPLLPGHPFSVIPDFQCQPVRFAIFRHRDYDPAGPGAYAVFRNVQDMKGQFQHGSRCLHMAPVPVFKGKLQLADVCPREDHRRERPTDIMDKMGIR